MAAKTSWHGTKLRHCHALCIALLIDRVNCWVAARAVCDSQAGRRGLDVTSCATCVSPTARLLSMIHCATSSLAPPLTSTDSCRYSSTRLADCSPLFRRDAMLARVLAMAMCPSVCVCHKSEFYRNGWANRAGFWHVSSHPAVCWREIRVSPKTRVFSSGTLFQILDFENFVSVYRPSNVIST